MNFRILGNNKAPTLLLIPGLGVSYEIFLPASIWSMSPKHWIGIDPHTAPDELLRDLTRNSYEIVKTKYSKKK